MKTLTIKQMEEVRAGSFWSCLGQVGTGMELLGSAALFLTAINPISAGLLVIGAVGFLSTVISDPYACD